LILSLQHCPLGTGGLGSDHQTPRLCPSVWARPLPRAAQTCPVRL